MLIWQQPQNHRSLPVAISGVVPCNGEKSCVPYLNYNETSYANGDKCWKRWEETSYLR